MPLASKKGMILTDDMIRAYYQDGPRTIDHVRAHGWALGDDASLRARGRAWIAERLLWRAYVAAMIRFFDDEAAGRAESEATLGHASIAMVVKPHAGIEIGEFVLTWDRGRTIAGAQALVAWRGGEVSPSGHPQLRIRAEEWVEVLP